MVVVEVGNQVSHEVQFALRVLLLHQGGTQLVLFTFLHYWLWYLFLSQLQRENVDIAGVAADRQPKSSHVKGYAVYSRELVASPELLDHLAVPRVVYANLDTLFGGSRQLVSSIADLQ